MLNITKKIEYGLIAMRHINQYGEKNLCSSSEIANKYHLPKEIFAKTMQLLSKKNYICSVKGPNGGYFLNKSLNQIKLIQFIEDIEGPIGIVKCNVDDNCHLIEFCNIKDPLMKINLNIRKALNKISLNEITN
tara:strand:+ start:1533 stop:1931 length:399 start_codon:yes stop_codon:yes gene_type:complete